MISANVQKRGEAARRGPGMTTPEPYASLSFLGIVHCALSRIVPEEHMEHRIPCYVPDFGSLTRSKNAVDRSLTRSKNAVDQSLTRSKNAVDRSLTRSKNAVDRSLTRNKNAVDKSLTRSKNASISL